MKAGGKQAINVINEKVGIFEIPKSPQIYNNTKYKDNNRLAIQIPVYKPAHCIIKQDRAEN